ncbi:hypothetical protein DL95DRAFT_48491 [Leptodontidium sp. 2 PMI_412]|nr:hypothetical protein DL95DRAFT_48491 [Leptodontidium sp. 2 PMI_412]
MIMSSLVRTEHPTSQKHSLTFQSQPHIPPQQNNHIPNLTLPFPFTRTQTHPSSHTKNLPTPFLPISYSYHTIITPYRTERQSPIIVRSYGSHLSFKPLR